MRLFRQAAKGKNKQILLTNFTFKFPLKLKCHIKGAKNKKIDNIFYYKIERKTHGFWKI